nr:MAG TPA: hypothetical protein [Caudoviricetes sp.]
METPFLLLSIVYHSSPKLSTPQAKKCFKMFYFFEKPF